MDTALTPRGENRSRKVECLVEPTGVEPVQTYLHAGGLQPLELANAQELHQTLYELAPREGFEPPYRSRRATSG